MTRHSKPFEATSVVTVYSLTLR